MLRGDASVERLDDKAFSLDWLGGIKEAGAKNTVDRLLHGFACAEVFLFEQGGYVVIDGQSGSHIMMFTEKAS